MFQILVSVSVSLRVECFFGCFEVDFGLMVILGFVHILRVYLQYEEKDEQKAEKQKLQKQKSREKQNSEEAERQSSRKAEKQRSTETKKQTPKVKEIKEAKKQNAKK